MNLYQVSTKYGRSPYQLVAYVEADSPKQAVRKYAGALYDENVADGMKYRATKTELPSYFWNMADYCRPQYIRSAVAK